MWMLLLILAVPVQGDPRAFAPAKTPAVTVNVRPVSEVAGSAFTLGEIAEIAAADRALAARLAAVEAGTSPLPGQSRGFSRGDALARLRFHGFDTRQIAVTCPPGVRITRRAVEVAEADLVRTATEAVAAARGGAEGVRIELARPLPRIQAPPGRLELQAGAPRGQLEGGLASVPVGVLVDGRPVRSVEIPLRIRRIGAVLVARRALEPRTLVTEDDLILVQAEAPPGAAPPLADPAQAVGRRTVRRIAAGAPVTAAMLEEVPVVAPGARVTLEVVSGGLTITAPAVARTGGAVGATIRVFVTGTRRDVQAVVVDNGTVRVEENP